MLLTFTQMKLNASSAPVPFGDGLLKSEVLGKTGDEAEDENPKDIP